MEKYLKNIKIVQSLLEDNYIRLPEVVLNPALIFTVFSIILYISLSTLTLQAPMTPVLSIGILGLSTGILVTLYHSSYVGRFTKLLADLIFLHTYLVDEKEKLSNFEEIYDKLTAMHYLIDELRYYAKYPPRLRGHSESFRELQWVQESMITHKDKILMMEGNAINIQKLVENEMEFLYSYIDDIIDDLHIRLQEQQDILQEAKSSLSTHIQGTPELLAVSEAQQIRLDRQIEQFEELQRVLVKI